MEANMGPLKQIDSVIGGYGKEYKSNSNEEQYTQDVKKSIENEEEVIGGREFHPIKRMIISERSF